MSLPNLPERFLTDRLPVGLLEEDINGLLAQLVGGYQDRLGDMRAQGDSLALLFDPLNAPPTQLAALQVSFIAPHGVSSQRLLDLQESTPYPVNPASPTTAETAALAAWAAAQMQVNPGNVTAVSLLTTDQYRSFQTNALALLAQTIGAPVYTNSQQTAAQVIATQRQLIAGHFARLKIKGTALAFDVLARAMGLGQVLVLPLWGRLSPRLPADIGNAANDADYDATPDIFPSATLPDPQGIYDPQVMDDGPYYAWDSGPMTVDPTRSDYVLNVVNGTNPFIQIAPTGTLAIPAPGSYYLVGGGIMARASVPLTDGNMLAEALAEGATFSADARDPNHPVGLKVVVTNGLLSDGVTPTCTFAVTDRLSAIKYRTNLYDVVLLVDLDVYTPQNLIPVQDNPNTILGVLASKPVTGFPLAPAFPGFRQVDPTALQQASLRATAQFEAIRPATRFPRRVTSGFFIRETASIYAPVANVDVLAANVGASQTRAAQGSFDPAAYSALFTLGADVLTAEADPTTEGYLRLRGYGISGYFSLLDRSFNLQSTSQGGVLTATYMPTDTEVIGAEPTTLQKSQGQVAYSSRPQDDLEPVRAGVTLTNPNAASLDFFDEYPWRREVTFDGEDVDLNTYEPRVPDESCEVSGRETHVLDENGIEYSMAVSVDPDAPGIPPRVVFTAVPTLDDDGLPVDLPPVLPALAFSGATVYHVGLVHGVAVCSPMSFLRDAFEEGLLSWLPCNEHPRDPLWVQEHISINSVSYTGQVLPGQRIWHVNRGWVLAAVPPAVGLLFSQEGYNGLDSTFTMAFHCQPATTNGTSSLFQFGPLTVTLANAVLSVKWYTTSGATLSVASTAALPLNVFSFVSILFDGTNVTLNTCNSLDGSNAQTFTASASALAGFNVPTVRQASLAGPAAPTPGCVLTIPDTGVLNDAGYTVLVNGTPWYRTYNTALALPTDSVFSVTFDAGNGIASLVFGDGTFGAVLPAGASVQVTYSVDQTFLGVMQGTAGCHLSDVRIWTVLKSAADLAWVRLPSLSATAVRYSQRAVLDQNGNLALGFYPLSSGYVEVVPLGGPMPAPAPTLPLYPLYPPALVIAPGGDNPGRVRRYAPDGSYDGDDAYMQTGRSGDPALPAVLDLDLTGHEVGADGEFAFSGTYALPDRNAAYTGAVTPLPGTNPVQRRVYVLGDDGETYEITLAATSAGVTLAATACPRARVYPLQQTNTQDFPSDNQTEFIQGGYVLAVQNNGGSNPVVYAKASAGANTGGLWLLLNQRTTLSVPFYAPTPLPSVTRTLQGDGTTRATRWTEFNTEPGGIDYGALDTEANAAALNAIVNPGGNALMVDPLPAIQASPIANLEYLLPASPGGGATVSMLNNTLNANGETQGAGNYLLEIELGIVGGTLSEGVVTAQIVMGQSATTGLGLGQTLRLLPTGPQRGTASVAFSLLAPLDEIPWSLVLYWYGERSLSSQQPGYGRRLALYSYRLVQLVSEVYQINLAAGGPTATQVNLTNIVSDPNNANTTDIPGGLTGRLNSQGVVAEWEHEATQYPVSADPLDTASTSLLSVAALLAAATSQHREQLLLTPQVVIPAATPNLPTFSLVTPSGTLYEGGEPATFSLTPATTPPPLTSYVWSWWDGSTSTTAQPTVAKHLTGNGTLAMSVLVLGPAGDTASYQGSITVRALPVIGSTTLTRTGQQVTFAVAASTPGEAQAPSYAWSTAAVRPCSLVTTDGTTTATFEDLNGTGDLPGPSGIYIGQSVTGSSLANGTTVAAVSVNSLVLSTPALADGEFLLQFETPLAGNTNTVSFQTLGLDQLLSVVVTSFGGGQVTESFYLPGLALPPLQYSGIAQNGAFLYSHANQAAANDAVAAGFEQSGPVVFSAQVLGAQGDPLTFAWTLTSAQGTQALTNVQTFDTGQPGAVGSRVLVMPMQDTGTPPSVSPPTSLVIGLTVSTTNAASGQTRAFTLSFPVTATFKGPPVISGITQTLSAASPVNGIPTLYMGDTGIFTVNATDPDGEMLTPVWMFSANLLPSGQQFYPLFGTTIELSLAPTNTDPNVTAYNALLDTNPGAGFVPLTALDNTTLYGTCAVFNRYGTSAIYSMPGITITDPPPTPTAS